MKCKRILSMLLTLCMVMSLFAGTTVTASAADGAGAAGVTKRTIPLDVTTGTITDTNGNAIISTTDTNGDSIYSCESEGWSYRLNRGNQISELTLSGVNFDIKDTNDSWAIMAPGKVILADGTENRVSTVSSNKTVAAINTPEITGSGILTVSATSTSDASGASCYGIYSMKDITLDQCSIVVDGVKCSNGSATGIFAAMGKALTITANTAKDNRITIKNVQGTTATKALGAAKNIVAKDAFVSGAEGSFTSGKTKTISFKDPKVPVIVSFVELPSKPEAATFTDGLGKTDCTFDTYTKDAKNEKGYTFAGWFGDDGNELTSAGNAETGKTYTAKWTKNGKTVRTTVLDLSTINTNQSNAEEGWSWDAASKTLTLNGVTIDAQLDKNAEAAIGASGNVNIITAEGTENFVYSHSEKKVSTAIYVEGNLTISGKGKLTVVGEARGIEAENGDIHINAPLSASATGSDAEAAIKITSEDLHEITIDSPLTIKQPEGGYIGKEEMCILEKGGTNAAMNVVIGAAAPTFTDGFGKTIENATSYEKGTTTNDKGYTFAGWFDGETELENTDAAVAGTTYTAKWTKNGKTVRTTGLDLTKISESNTLGAKYDNGVYVNTAEGWTWMPGDNGGTLLLENCTIDVPGVADSAVSLPDGATLTTAANTQNTLSNVSTGSIEALWGEGAVTITGSGSLSLSGCDYGLSAGEITINAPITMIATNKQNGTAVAGGSITINSALSITEPSGGQIRENGGFHYIADRNGKFATNVVIGVAAPTFTDGLGNANCAFDTYTKGATNDKGYTFAGWFNGETELTSADAAVAGTTYTAKWTKNGKTVRTTSLDLTKISKENTFGATLTDGVYTNADEGWSWNPETKTLTLSGTTMDIPDRAQESQDDLAAVCLPDGAIITTAADTQNILSNSSTIEMGSSAVLGMGALTVTGSGSLSVSGTNAGFYAMGNIAINAPITATATTERGGMAVLAKGITIDSSLDITVPTGGIIMTDRMTGIADSEGHFSANVVIGVAVKYTVTYNTNGGSAVAPVTVSENSKLIAPTAPTKAGYTFHGWYKDAAFTNRWNFDADTVTGNITLYAKWAETTKIYGISGTVYESNGTTPASGVSVKLMKGDTQVADATSASDGAYSFTGIAPGVYNIVAEKEDTTQTTLVIVTNHDETGKNVTLPQSKVNSKLTVNGADTPDVVAGGLAEESAAVKADNPGATSVKVEMTVESKSSAAVNTSDKTKIEAVASGKTLEYLDIKVTKTVDGTDSAITTTANMMEIVIPYDMTGKSNITVYRNHNGSAAAFTQLSTRPVSGAGDGTYYLDTVNHLIYVYTQKFSTYAIGYNTQSGGGSGSGGSSSGGGSSSSSGGSSSGNSSTISTPSAKNGTVSVSPKSASKGTTVTVTVTPDKGYVLETLTVTDASGKKLDLKNLGSGKYSFTMPASKVEVKATFMEDNTMLNYFVDVPASAYYYDAVLWAAERGITGGTDATRFSPDGVCTRAQAVTFLWRAAGSPAPSATAMPFTDVAADSYYYNAVLWAMENGITAGTSSTTFSPDLKCSRAHIMTFLWRSEKSPAAGSVNPFTDVSADAYYADAVLWAVKESVTNGTSSATFSPDADCTRAQIVTFIWRTLAR
ncbi:S-layer homology domain-containing protein [Agathobaculum sp. LCP25S3_E8]|uniref:S-layer homology domain-containing protein n=1 Tax=Agathobaculum sp. LCP25S3_E8 TaxID=3438735 RepID=UPI003F8F02CE